MTTRKKILPKLRRVYFIGITGTSVSGLAVIAKQLGYEVTGSDVDKVFTTNAVLKKQRIPFHLGFSASHLDWAPDVVVVGASWDDTNVEVAEVKKRRIPLMPASEFLNLLAQDHELIAIAGVHGKTTTTSFLTYLLLQAGLDPSFMIGSGSVPGIGTNARGSLGKYFVVEADEYKKGPAERTSKFLDYDPKFVLLTSIELDHTDFFPTLAAVKKSFRKLLQKKSIKRVYANIDDVNVRAVVHGLGKKVVTVGTAKNAQVKISDVTEGTRGVTFQLQRGKLEARFVTRLPGVFGVRNASLCLSLVHDLGIPWDHLVKAAGRFQGAERRFQLSKHGSFWILDDFAHHPTAVRLTLEAARKRFPNKKIICVYQPHQVSRTRRFKDAFAQSFGAADEVILADIFASAREKADGYSSRDLVALTKKFHRHVSYGGSLAATARRLNKKRLDASTIVVTMGAGDVYTIKKLLKK